MTDTSTDVKFERRNEIEAARRPEIGALTSQLSAEIWHKGSLPSQLKKEVFLLSSLSAGCQHCQSHAAYGIYHEGISVERIQAMWDFERSPEFTDAEKAAYRFARDAGLVPNAVTPQHYVDLRQHYSDAQIADMLCVISYGGWLNRWNDSLATVTDQEASDWAAQNLSPVGWDRGKHVGDKSEQRDSYPPNMRRSSNPAQT